MTTTVSHAVKPIDLSFLDGELQQPDMKATGEVTRPKRDALPLAARLQIGKTLLGAAKDISISMKSLVGDADIADPSDDYRADADPAESPAESEADSVEDEARSGSDTEDESGGRGRDGDGQPRDDQSSRQHRDDSDLQSLVIDGDRPRRHDSPDGNRTLPPSPGKMSLVKLETASKKMELALRHLGSMAMNLPVKMDQLTHAPELILMQLNMELSQIIDSALYSQLADQKARNAMIADHQTMMDALRIEKGSIGDTDGFNWQDHNPVIALHPESPARADGSEEFAAFVNDPYIKAISRGYEVVGLSSRKDDKGNPIFVVRMTRTVNGQVETKDWLIDSVHYRDQPGVEKLATNYINAAATAKGGSSGSMTLMDCLKAYGIVAEGKEPKNGGEVDAYIQKIKGVVDKLSSSQQLDMVRLQKMTNSRNEAFSMISNVNKQALDNRMAIVNNLR
jgi:hypothetical protein